jgi:uncharacterized protein
LIGKRLQCIKDPIAGQKIIIVLSEQLLQELRIVAQRPKLKKYFLKQKVKELIEFVLDVGQNYQLHEKSIKQRPKNNFLLDLAELLKLTF